MPVALSFISLVSISRTPLVFQAPHQALGYRHESPFRNHPVGRVARRQVLGGARHCGSAQKEGAWWAVMVGWWVGGMEKCCEIFPRDSGGDSSGI